MKAPRWAVFAGGTLAMVVATAVPGLAALLKAFDHSAAASEALYAEIPLALASFGFGALMTRAQLAKSRRWTGALLVLGLAVLVFFIGVGLSIGDASHTVDGGGVLVLGGLLSLGAAAVQAVLALMSWWAIAAGMTVAEGASGPSHARMSGLLFIASVIHVALKLISGGSVVFGALGALIAALLSRSAALKSRMAYSGVFALVALALQARSCSESNETESVAGLPICITQDSTARQNDVLARRARELPKVAEAAADGDAERVTVYVLPVDAAPLDDALKKEIETALAPIECAVWDGHSEARKPRVDVVAARPLPLDIQVTMHSNAPLPDDVGKAVESSVRATFAATKGAAPLVHVPGRASWNDPSLTGILGWGEFHTGNDGLQSRLMSLPSGSYVVVGKVDVTVIPPQPK